ncbi:MAG: DNA-directed RNA polymerase subunit alpha [Desulfobacterales bacterium]|nr:DNA-directed RNA polymerase subunit alpha [Desulfobacterales bacterium]
MSSNELMYMNWRELIKPRGIAITGSTPSYAKFVCEPLERGFAITIGNSLRRILLSSLYGAAIVSVKIDNVMHEFTAIAGVLEDVSEVILNLKEVHLRMSDPGPKVLRIEASGEGEVKAGDIIFDGGVEILNPEHHIASLSKDAKLDMTMMAKVGKGYVPADMNKGENDPIGTIPIDAVFSPIKRVNYVVGNARVGQRTDYDKLTLEVWTDGSIAPEDAVAYAAKILKEQMTILINFDEAAEPEPEPEREEEEEKPLNENLYRGVDELELSVRSANCLKNANLRYIGELVCKTEPEMLKTKNFGRKSLNEIKEVLTEMGLTLGMKIDGFVPREEETKEGETSDA